MVRHQAVRVDLNAKGILQLTQINQVALVIFVSGEFDLAVVTSLDDMVQVVRQNKAAHPRHRGVLHSVENGVRLSETREAVYSSRQEHVWKINLSPFAHFLLTAVLAPMAALRVR